MYIYFRADSSTMNMDERRCEAFRKWAGNELQNAYPDHEVCVVNEFKNGTFSTSTDDEENETEIIAFGDNLWDSCDWDAVEKLVRQYALN